MITMQQCVNPYTITQPWQQVSPIVTCYVCGILNGCVYTGNKLSLSFYQLNVVPHFFCDVLAVMALSCSDRHVNGLVLINVACFNIFFALLVILISYTTILITILKMHPDAEHWKAISTCASHFTAVSIFYGTLIFTYLQPSSSHSVDTDKIASVFYTMVIPMLNPVVYSLRNKEVKRQNNLYKFCFKFLGCTIPGLLPLSS
jgi:olfactory receptor